MLYGIGETKQHNGRGQHRMGEMSSTLYHVQTRVGIELDSYQDRGSFVGYSEYPKRCRPNHASVCLELACEVSSKPNGDAISHHLISPGTNHANTTKANYCSQHHQQSSTFTPSILATSYLGQPPIDARPFGTPRSLNQRLPSTSSIIIPQAQPLYTKS